MKGIQFLKLHSYGEISILRCIYSMLTEVASVLHIMSCHVISNSCVTLLKIIKHNKTHLSKSCSIRTVLKCWQELGSTTFVLTKNTANSAFAEISKNTHRSLGPSQGMYLFQKTQRNFCSSCLSLRQELCLHSLLT